jgi:Tol biopolymer transport system component
MKYSGLSREGLATLPVIPQLRLRRLAPLAVLMGVLVAVTPAAARPAGHNGQIVFGRDDPLVGHTVYTVNPDGSHEHQLLSVPVDLQSPHWSPDGTKVVAGPAETGDAAWIIDADTGAHRALPNPDPAAFDIFPCGVPSPDFERLACGGFGKDPSANGIYTIRTSDGGGLRRLTSDTIEDGIGDFSPDGKRLVYFHIPPEVFDHDPPDFGLAGLFVLRVNGTGTRKIAPCCSSGGSWSPKGNDIVFSSAPPDFQVHSTLWMVHSDGSGLHQLPIPQAFCGGRFDDPDARGCVDPVWSPDGKKIVFRLTTPGFGEGGDVWTVDAGGTSLTQVTHDGDVEWPDWGTHPLATD